MVTRIRKGTKPHLYVREWMEARGLSGEQVAARVGVARETIWRWCEEQHRLSPQKIGALAEALDLEPEDLWRTPGRRSVDAILKDASENDHNAVLEFVTKMVKRA